MPDIITPSTPTSPSGTPAAPVGSVNAVGATVNNAPDKIQQLSHQIQVSGLISAMPDGGTVTLNTIIGPLTLLLPQLAQAQQDKLLQQLISMFQNQKPLTVMVEPGNPPSQAFMLLPPLTTPAGQNPSQPPPNVAPTTLPPNATPAQLTNAVLSALVLPKDIVLPSVAGSNLNPGFNQGSGGGFNPGTNLPVDLAAAATAGGEADETALVEQALAKLQGQALPDIVGPSSNLVAPAPEELMASPTMPATPSAIPSPASPVFQNAPVPQTPLASPASVLSPNTNAGLLQPGNELNLRVSAVILPAQAVTQSPVLTAPNQFIATVAGQGPGGQLILKTGDATLYVRQSANLPVGTQLVVTAEPAHVPLAVLPSVPDRQLWATLPQAMSAMMQVDPALARAVIESHVPQPGEALPGALLFFLSAVRQGDVRSWLGNSALDLLIRAGKYDLIGKLAQDMQQAGQTVRDGTVGDWRSYPVPLHNNNQFQIVHFYVHGDRQHRHQAPEGKDGRPSATQIRFLIDVRMSRLGAMQLDGFVRPKQLDMIVRSEMALPPGLDRELRQAYIGALGAIAYAGTIGFQTGRPQWVNFQKTAEGKVLTT